MVRPGITTLTVMVHRGSVLAAGQLLPGAVVVPVVVMTWPPAGQGSATRIDPVIVTVPPTGTSPVHTAPVPPTDSVPEVAASLPTSLIWSAVFEVEKATLIPKYGVCPVLVIVVVSSIRPPGKTAPGLPVESITSSATVTVTAHRGSVLPGAQLFPAAAEVTVLVRILSPAAGLFTVAEKVTVAESPGFRSPVQVR